MESSYEYVDCAACEGTGNDKEKLCSVCRGDGVVIRKLNEYTKHNPERIRQTMKRIERMFTK